jgi:hydroxymethylpyrimidine/phosphomethylpyrimidine kinase
VSSASNDGSDEYPRVLCVGGTDPTGAAGLFADMRAVACGRAYASGVVTAVTVQTSRGVTDVIQLPASVVGAELDAALLEPGASVVKTGMLVGEDIVRALVERLLRTSSVKLVVDPVLRSSSGRPLLDEAGTRLLLSALVPRAALVTPNLPELRALTGVRGDGRDAMGRGADQLLLLGANAVLVKGGHASDEGDGQVHDLFRTADGDELWVSRTRRLGTFRGTGCTLAAIVSARLAHGFRLKDAILEGRDYLDQAMSEGLSWEGRPTLLGPVGPGQMS